MTSQNFPSPGANVYKAGATGAAAGSGSASQANGNTFSNRRPPATKWTIRKSGISKSEKK